ncbi:MAG: hypothetical protein R2813_10875 [Flavobacteriales bacterium]
MINFPHTFHIPVMGTGYTIDSPIKVARFGINSVVSIIDHRLMEMMREYYSNEFGKPFYSINEKSIDSREKRITTYLDFMGEIVAEQFERIRNEEFTPSSEINKYFELLPDDSPLKCTYLEMLALEGSERISRENQLREQMVPGRIDVNVMTKVDRQNFARKNQPLPTEYNDAHSAIRGFAKSKLKSSVVLSAGLNPRLYGYIAEFADFLPDKNGNFNKQIILKVSDYRSALIQGKFLAKKGLWVTEFRIESGLNCGGHAFATDGHLIGSILQEFRDKSGELQSTLHSLYAQAMSDRDGTMPNALPAIRYSVQGGVGSAEEHEFLMNEYGVCSVGWGSPFLLVPEAVNIDADTMRLLSKAGEGDLYLSNISPLGVPFNTVKGTTAELERDARIKAGKPGSPCYKEHLISNREFTSDPICTASRQYQRKKMDELRSTITDESELKKAFEAVTEKTCLCVGLGNSAMGNAGAKLYNGMRGVVVCPGPNMAYFSREVSLKEMVDHIYGRTNILIGQERPHMFVKELSIYVDYLKKLIDESRGAINQKQAVYFQSFKENLDGCIDYYKQLVSDSSTRLATKTDRFIEDVNVLKIKLQSVMMAV